MDVDGFLERENVPDQFRRPFHEIILARGQFPLNATEDQIEVFAQEANQITSSHRMDPMEAHLTNVVFKEFMGKWRKYSVRSN